eukprot:s557_g4.t1
MPDYFGEGLHILKRLAGLCTSFDSIGRGLAWVFLNFPGTDLAGNVDQAFRLTVMGKAEMNYAMHRGPAPRSRPLFPLAFDNAGLIKEAAVKVGLEEFCSPHFAGLSTVEIWTLVGVLGLNGLAGYGRAILERKPTDGQKRAADTMRKTTRRVLPAAETLLRSVADAEKELAARFVSYSGEEVPKMQVLSMEAAQGALPPLGHGGAIDARQLVCSGTQWFLDHPEESLLDKPLKNAKLQARVHIREEEALDFCKLLVERQVCTWVPDGDVLVVNGEQVLNGMFAVGKGTLLETGVESQRTIMNLIPTNSVFKQIQGGTAELPSICQYLSLVVQNNENMVFYQSDMSCAFYLFRIPKCWSRMMVFNIKFSSKQLGLPGDQWYRPGCAVIPMGWSSAVAVMQELAERLTVLGKLPAEHRIRRQAPLPSWLTHCLEEGAVAGQAWYHVYLDNFCAMEKGTNPGSLQEGADLHRKLEEAWRVRGVLLSEKKRVAGADSVQELGASINGVAGTMGPGGGRLLRLLQSTLAVVSAKRLRRKWVQIIAGRWVHCMSFRRPSMVCLDATWGFISEKTGGPMVEARVRSEFVNCCCIALLIHTNLRAGLSEVTTASDASMTGGAVGKSIQLDSPGCQFAWADKQGLAGAQTIPVLCLSLFNGVGCAFRCYDLIGLCPQVCIAYEIEPSANRVTSRRWPHVRMEGDIRSLTLEVIREWRYLYPSIEELHVWFGFPCVGLSSVRAGRLNLDDPQSGLFWEAVRVIRNIRQVFGFNFRVLYAGENVASMDAAAEGEITKTLGVKPLRLDPAQLVPIHRPRFCWTNAELTPVDGVVLEDKARWIEVQMSGTYPDLSQWLEPGAEWPGYEQGAVLPTCMKSIRRSRPPPAPAGYDRIDFDTEQRWRADDFRFPPYQYADRRDIILEDVGITRNTLDRYYLAVNRLLPALEGVCTEFGLDEAIAEWIQTEFEDGTPLHLVADALCGLHHFEPFTKKKLPQSWRLYGIWRRYEVPFRAPPLPQDIALAMAGWAIWHGELTMGALLLLAFHCLLRTGEILQIRPCDFVIDSTSGVLSIPSSKSGVRNNSRESVTIRDPSTLETTLAMLELKSQFGMKQVPCWEKSGSAFRSLFRTILVELQIENLNFRPYSLRRGGATWEMQCHGLMERTLIRGRWKNSNVARLYICDGLAMLPRLKMSLEAKHNVARFSSLFSNEHQAFADGKRGKKRKI